ncbi:MAG: SGNH/GDSL hydrolase family protein [Gemmatimonadales bacterium]
MLRRSDFQRVMSVALLAGALTACIDDETLLPPEPAAGGMFSRYVAIGNSITAGFQSGGINETTQLQSYVALLAEGMGHTIGETFRIPLMNNPGCPPLYADIFTQARTDTIPNDCALRKEAEPFLNNVAVPGAAVIDVFTNFDAASNPNPLTTFILGGRSQVEAAREVQPTFVTVWIGNNDVLGAILDTSAFAGSQLITDTTTFASRYGAMMDSLDAIGTIQGGVLVGVVQVTGAPYVSRGGAYFLAATQIPTLTVDLNCLDAVPLTATDTAFVMVPFHYGAPLLSAAAAGVPTTLDCSDGHVISALETASMMGTVEAYNRVISAEAAERDWVYVDPNALLLTLAADTSAIRPFPAFPPDPASATTPFGSALSLDGIHPSAATHVTIANALVQAINAAYKTNISPATSIVAGN